MAKIKNTNELNKWASEWLNDVALEIFNKSQENIDHMSVNYTGQLKKSGIINTAEDLRKSITYNVPYASSVEFGAEAHFVPMEPLIRWARIKAGKGEAFAKYVQKKILAEGTPPRMFLSAAITWSKEQFVR